jgi:hypothetical protein
MDAVSQTAANVGDFDVFCRYSSDQISKKMMNNSKTLSSKLRKFTILPNKL